METNLWVLIKKQQTDMNRLVLLAALLMSFSACKKDDPTFFFGVEDVTVTQSSADKNRLKTDIEFVSIAYADLFGGSISQSALEDIIITYKSFGDKSMVIEMIIRKYIADEASNVGSIDRSSQATTESFVQSTYEKLYNRTPNAFEKWYLSDLIQTDSDINAEMVYYAMMTANEYRYY